MSLRRHLLQAPYSVISWLNSRRWFPFFRTFLRGHEWPYDVACLLRTRDIGVIIDVGANIGQTALYLRRHFTHAPIHCFELSPRTAEILRRNTAQCSGISVHARGLSHNEGTARIRLQPVSEFNSLRHATQEGGSSAEVETVGFTTLDAFVEEYGIGEISILKIDAQASDLDVLRGAETLLRAHRVRFIYVEVTFQPDAPDSQTFAPLHDHLAARGYRLSHFYEQWNLGPSQIFCNALYHSPAVVQNGSPT